MKLFNVLKFGFQLFLVFGLNNICFSQPGDILNVIPPSPEAAALGKYGYYPVDMYSGTVKVEIPIYDIKSGDLELPISLSYHASGIKVDEVASWAGLGWVLNAGGVLSRTVNGKPDEDNVYKHIITTAEINSNSGNYLASIANGSDNENDVYAYNVNGLVGTFTKDNQNQIIQIPCTDNKIIEDIENNQYIIISNDGTKYYFTETDFVISNTITNYISSWYLTKIESANGSDFIYFEYSAEDKQYCKTIYETDLLQYLNLDILDVQRNYTTLHSSTPILQKIRFKQGYIDLIKAGDRKDRSKYRLSELNIYTTDHKLIKKVSFDHDYFVSDYALPPNYSDHSMNVHYRLKLTSITMRSDSSDVERYSFNYNLTKLPHYFVYFDDSRINDFGSYFGQDLWGYYNGVRTNQYFFKEFPIGKTCLNCLPTTPPDRNTYLEYAKACVLEEIVYPTGGKTKFEYESNYGSGVIGGGLRISAIKNYDNISSEPSITTYKYPSGTSFQYISTLKSIYNYQYDQISNVNGIDAVRTNLVSNPSVFPGYCGANSTIYDEVIVYKGTESINTGKTEYDFEFDSDVMYGGPAVKHPQIQNLRYPNYIINMSWVRGQIKKETQFENKEGTYSEIENTLYEYQKYKESEHIVGITSFANFRSNHPDCPWAGDYYQFYACFQYFDIKARTGVKLLKKTTKTVSTSSGKVITETTYNYIASERDNNPHFLPTSILSSGSDKLTTEVKYKYPFDYGQVQGDPNNIDQIAIAGLINRNINKVPIEKLQIKDKKIVNGQIFRYKVYPPIRNLSSMTSIHKILPYEFYSTETNSPIENFVESDVFNGSTLMDATYKLQDVFDNYDSDGNLLQHYKVNNITTSFLWGYNKSLPVAKAINAKNEITYENGMGNIIISYAPGYFEKSKNIFSTNRAGDITFSLTYGGAPGTAVSNFNYFLSGKGTGTLCISYNSTECGSFPSTITFPSMPAGDYTLEVFPNKNTALCNVSFNAIYPALVKSDNSALEIYYEGFEENAGATEASSSTPSYAGRYHKSTPYYGSFILPKNKAYTIDYHYRSGSKWVFVKKPLTTSSFTITDGTAVDEIRIYPSDAQVTTYTYAPLIGMTSQTDPNGVTTYYEYDSFGRLKWIKDDDGNILKTFDYHYSGQTK